jgi:hypothetical protein
MKGTKIEEKKNKNGEDNKWKGRWQTTQKVDGRRKRRNKVREITK